MNKNRDNLQNVLSSNVQPSEPKPTCDAPDTVYPGYMPEVPHIAEIPILGKTYRVDFRCREDGMETLGTMDRAQQRIRIYSDQAYDQRCDTLCHEVLHAINDELKLGLSEVTICRLAVGLHSAGYIRDPGEL